MPPQQADDPRLRTDPDDSDPDVGPPAIPLVPQPAVQDVYRRAGPVHRDEPGGGLHPRSSVAVADVACVEEKDHPQVFEQPYSGACFMGKNPLKFPLKNCNLLSQLRAYLTIFTSSSIPI